MKLSDKYKISNEFESVFKFDNKEDEIDHEAKILMFKFLATLENLQTFKGLKKKDLAVLLGTSASYITQIYKGDKIINLLTLARLQEVFDVTFDVTIKVNSKDYLKKKNYSH
jgi:plasmid maintenance system antidote protein VapI